MKIATRILAVLALLSVPAFAQTQPAPVAQAANTQFICVQRCEITAVTDAAGNPVSGLFQYGSPDNGFWGVPFSPSALPLEVNYTGETYLGWAGFEQYPESSPYMLVALQGTVPYYVKWQNFDPDPVVGTVLVPAVPTTVTDPTPPTDTTSSPTPTPTSPAPTPDPVSTPAPTTPPPTTVVVACPTGIFAEIATGYPQETAAIPAGTIYKVAQLSNWQSSPCSQAQADITIDASTGYLFILRTNVYEVISVTWNGQTASVRFDPDNVP